MISRLKLEKDLFKTRRGLLNKNHLLQKMNLLILNDKGSLSLFFFNFPSTVFIGD